jgi:hypothetical protein
MQQVYVATKGEKNITWMKRHTNQWVEGEIFLMLRAVGKYFKEQ